MKLVNLTPHPITIITDAGNVTIQPEPEPARVTMLPPERYDAIDVDGVTVPVMTTAIAGGTTGLPDPQDGVKYIVSMQVAGAIPGRKDLLITNDAVRDGDGRVIGCRSLARPLSRYAWAA